MLKMDCHNYANCWKICNKLKLCVKLNAQWCDLKLISKLCEKSQILYFFKHLLAIFHSTLTCLNSRAHKVLQC